jgi:drug/metabolite transporter (DMT)-like permease
MASSAPTTTAPAAGAPAVERTLGQWIVLGFALFSMYVIWGSTYIAIKFGLEGFPPFLLIGIRFYVAGSVLFVALLLGGAKLPRPVEWCNVTLVGFLMLTLGSGGLALAQLTVSSGLAAIAFATIPLWTALFSGLLINWAGRGEWLALGVGLLGIVLLNLDGEFRSSPLGMSAILLGSAGWGLGTVLQVRLRMPPGFMVTAVQMLTSGITCIAIGLWQSELIAIYPSPRALGALIYLIVGPSMIAYSCHRYLVMNLRPVVANSFAYTNPVIAVNLGVLLGGETFSPYGIGALGVVMVSLYLLSRSRARE